MMKGLASDQLAKLRIAPHRFALLAALALGLVLGLPAAARSDGDALDVATLRVRLKDTPAIGPVAKLRLKSEIEDLVNDLAAFHARRATDTLDELAAWDPGVRRSSRGDARRSRTVRLAGEELTPQPPGDDHERDGSALDPGEGQLQY